MGAPRGPTVTMAESSGPALHAAVARLLPQLSSSSAPPTAAQLQRIIEDPATTLFVARSRGDDDAAEGGVVGMLTLAVFLVPTGVRAWIEDVVVDDGSRGGGVASALVRAALDLAAQRGARTVDLTSRPDREAANRLYVRLGFSRRETNVYRFTLESAG
jgi:ribosomal protein S18 acetylase RimI-like enzyme